MGRRGKFKASLDWILKFDTLQRVLEGQFEVPRLRDTASQPPRVCAKETLLSQEMQAQEKAFRLSLCKTLGEQIYGNWFEAAGVECTPSGVILSEPMPS